jgi:hypothetical protein
MPLWGNTDDAANSVGYAVEGYGKEANSANKTAFFGNVTANAFVSGMTVGQFGVDITEMGVAPTGNVTSLTIVSSGSGYNANATVTFTGGGYSVIAAANAQSNATGRIEVVNLTAQGSSYETEPVVTVSTPANLAFSGNTLSVNVTSNYITLGANGAFFANGDYVTYFVAASNTAITPLANNTSYWVVGANSTALQLSTAKNGSPVDITAAEATAQAGHFLRGTAAVVDATLTWVAGDTGYAHTGWNIRKVLPNGRVQTECLVAMSKNAFAASDASDDTILPDA